MAGSSDLRRKWTARSECSAAAWITLRFFHATISSNESARAEPNEDLARGARQPADRDVVDMRGSSAAPRSRPEHEPQNEDSVGQQSKTALG